MIPTKQGQINRGGGKVTGYERIQLFYYLDMKQERGSPEGSFLNGFILTTDLAQYDTLQPKALVNVTGEAGSIRPSPHPYWEDCMI